MNTKLQDRPLNQDVAVKLIYFAWVRERIGKPEEFWIPEPSIATVRHLISWLSQKGDNYAHAFENPEIIRIALDKRHASQDTALVGIKEIAFFPPMTGG